MKKITFIAALFVATTLTYAQKVYDFTTGNPGTWTNKGSASNATQTNGVGMTLTFNSGTPRFDITRAVDPIDLAANPYTHVIITLINNNTEIETIGFGHDKNSTGSGVRYLSTSVTPALTAGAGVEQTLVIEVGGNAEWTNDQPAIGLDSDGTPNMEYFLFRFRNASDANLTADSATNGNLIIKSVRFVQAGTVQKSSYNFATEGIAGFVGLTGATVVDGGSTLDVSGDGTKTTPKVSQTFYSVDASSASYVHLVVDSNLSNADEVKFQFIDAGSNSLTYGSNPLNLGTATTIDIKLDGRPEWTGNITEWRFVFSESVSGAVIDANPIKISQIVFDNNITLSTEKQEFNASNFSFYPNPANNVVYFKGNSQITKAAIYDITGKQVFETSRISNNSLDISKLKSGLYLLSVTDKNDMVSTKKLLKK